MYILIPGAKKGKGKIHLRLANKLMEFDAITELDSLPTGTKVIVKDILKNNLMLVLPTK